MQSNASVEMDSVKHKNTFSWIVRREYQAVSINQRQVFQIYFQGPLARADKPALQTLFYCKLKSTDFLNECCKFVSTAFLCDQRNVVFNLVFGLNAHKVHIQIKSNQGSPK